MTHNQDFLQTVWAVQIMINANYPRKHLNGVIRKLEVFQNYASVTLSCKKY